MLGTSLPINLIRGSMLYVYVDLLGMDAGAYATVYAFYGVIDALDNPVFGYISDRTRSRWGRRRPFLFIGALVLFAAMVALFVVPQAVVNNATSLIIWFTIFAILSEMADSLINAAYGALLPELFDSERLRARANAVRQGCQMIALVFALGMTPVLAQNLLGCVRDRSLCPDGSTTCAVAVAQCPNPAKGYGVLAIIYGFLGAAIIIWMVLGIHENPEVARAPQPHFWRSAADILRNHYFWTIGLVSACYLAAFALTIGGLQLFVSYSLGMGGQEASILQVTVVLATVVLLPAWAWLVGRWGAARAWRLALPLAAVGYTPLWFAHSLPQALVAGLCIAVGLSGMLATNDVVLARVLDEDARQRGVHREGIFLSAFGVLGRLSGLLSSLALASLAWFFGYHSGANPGPQPGLAFRVYMSVYPLGLLLVGAVMAWMIAIPAGPNESAATRRPRLPGSPRPASPGETP